VLFHIPQLRMLDGVEIIPEEKVKSENLHGSDVRDREMIFKTMLPQENFVDRRIYVYEDIEEESEDEMLQNATSQTSDLDESVARQYVGELFSRVQNFSEQ